MAVPAVVVEGVGAVGLPVPPVGFVYHKKFVPVAVSAVAVAFWQYVMVAVTVGGGVDAVTLTVIANLGPSQLFAVWLT